MGRAIQMIDINGEYALFITEVLLNEDGRTGRIRFNGKPTALAREEHFEIEGQNVITEQFHFPVGFLNRFLDANGLIIDGSVQAGVWLGGGGAIGIDMTAENETLEGRTSESRISDDETSEKRTSEEESGVDC